MKPREELITLIKNAGTAEAAANAIIKDGWQKRPLKLGQTVYVIEVAHHEKHAICPYKISSIHERNGATIYAADKLYSGGGLHTYRFTSRSIGKTVFKKEQEALQTFANAIKDKGQSECLFIEQERRLADDKQGAN